MLFCIQPSPKEGLNYKIHTLAKITLIRRRKREGVRQRERERGDGGSEGGREGRKRERERERERCLFVGWFLNVPATCECISGTDLHRQFYVLPH